MLKTCGRHDETDRQKHADKVGTKGKIANDENGKKEYRQRNDSCADFFNRRFISDLLCRIT